MALVTQVLHHEQQLLAAFRKFAHDTRIGFVRRRAYRTARDELRALSFAELNQIGVGRGEIPYLAWKEACRQFPKD